MARLGSGVTNFQKCIDVLKGTECSEKEKRLLFEHIADHLCGPAASTATVTPRHAQPAVQQKLQLAQQKQQHQHQKQLSTACGLLLMFTEEQDAAVRMAAEEQLHRIVRANEHSAITRLLYDFHYELLKNGHQRSLRVALALFGAYMARIRQRKAKAYATVLAPLLAQVSRRTETAVLEALEVFVRQFAEYLLGALHDNDVRRLVDVFLADMTAECAVKRRCAAQNVAHIVERARLRPILARHAVNRALEQLVQSAQPANLCGVLGFLRVFLPVAVGWICGGVGIDVPAFRLRVCELFDMCVQFVCDPESGHSVINAALEVIVVVTSADVVRQLELGELLTSVVQQQAVDKRNTLRQQWHRNSASQAAQRTPDSLTITVNEETVSRESDMSLPKAEDGETATTTTPKATSPQPSESIGSMISSLLSQTNTDKVTKFFNRRSDSLPATPLLASPSAGPPSLLVRQPDDTDNDDGRDDRSIQSLGTSSNTSHLSAAFSELNLSEDLPLGAQSSAAGSMEFEFTTPVGGDDDGRGGMTPNLSTACETPASAIGDPMQDVDVVRQDQITRACRLIASKFLLAGQKGQLHSDATVRVSVKNLALQVLCNCVVMRPGILLETVPKVVDEERQPSVVQSERNERSEECVDAAVPLPASEEKPVEKLADENAATEKPQLLHIIDDHFGQDEMDVVNAMCLEQLEQSPNVSDISEPEIMMPPAEVRNQPLETVTTTKSVDLTPKVTEPQQDLSDLLLYLNDSDPMLRGNLVALVGHFVDVVFSTQHQSIETFSGGGMTFDRCMQAMFVGLVDDSHIVVKQALIATELILVQLLRWATPVQFECEEQWPKSVLSEKRADSSVHLVELVLDRLQTVINNKYWVVQCKYCELIGSLRFEDVDWQLGGDKRQVIEATFLQHLYAMLIDKDARVRSAAALSLCTYLKGIDDEHVTTDNNHRNTLYNELVTERVFHNLPTPMCDILEAAYIRNSPGIERRLGKVLFHLTNELLNVGEKHQQLGHVNAILELVRHFRPVHFKHIYAEFNVLEVCGPFLVQNHIVGTDLGGQCDLLEICVNLLAHERPGSLSPIVELLLVHCVKVLNIFQHVITGSKPLFVPRGQKQDLFSSARDMLAFQAIGYFGNDYFYLHLYNSVLTAYGSYRLHVNADAGATIFPLLRNALRTLHAVLELKSPVATRDPIKLIEELLGYLATVLPFGSHEAIGCVQHLMRFMFARNFACRYDEYVWFVRQAAKEMTDDGFGDETMGERFAVMRQFLKNWSFEADTPTMLGMNIKIFEPMVIQCMKFFPKNDASAQADILDMIAEILTHRVSYRLLDANNLFIDFVFKLLEIIETGNVRHSERVVPSIFRFLFNLVRQRDQQLITIPKIINVCDNLLANKHIFESAALALNELAFEFFFRTPMAGEATDDVGAAAVLENDASTEREVVVSMLLKYMETEKIHRSICAVMLLNRPSISDTEVLVNLIQALDKKLSLSTEFLHSTGILLSLLEPESIVAQLSSLFTMWTNSVLASKHAQPARQAQLQNILLEHCILVAGEAAIAQRLPDDERTHLRDSLQLSVTEMDGVDFVYAALAACLDRCLENNAHCAPETVAPFFRIVLGHSARMSNTLVAWRQRILRADIGGPAALMRSLGTHDVRLVLQFIDLLVKCGCDIASILLAVDGSDMSAHYHRVTAHALRKVSDGDALWCRSDLNLLLDHFEPIVWTTSMRPEFLLQSALALAAANDKGGIVVASADNVHVRMLSGFHRLVVAGRLAETKVETYTHLLNACQLHHTPQATDDADVEDDNGKDDNDDDDGDIVQMCIHLYKAYPMRRTADALIRQLNATSMSVMDDGHPAGGGDGSATTEMLLKRAQLAHGTRDAALLSALQQHHRHHHLTTTTPEPPIALGSLNDTWLAHEIERIIARRSAPPATVVRMVHQIKSEPLLAELLATDTIFSGALLADTLTYAGQRMIDAFAAACVQHTPHIDYLKVSVHLGACLVALQQRTAAAAVNADDVEHFVRLLPAVRSHLGMVDKLRRVAVRYVDTDTLQRFVAKHLCTAAQLRRYGAMLHGVLCTASGLLTVTAASRFSSGFVLMELLSCAELILKHVAPKHNTSSATMQLQQQQQVNNGVAHTADASASSSLSPQDDNKRRDAWLQSVHDMLAHLAGHTTAFDRRWTEHARPLDGPCTAGGKRSQQARWVAQCVMMWRRRRADDGDDDGSNDGGVVVDGDIDNVMNALIAIAVRLMQSTELYAYAIMPPDDDGHGDDDAADGATEGAEDLRGYRLPSIPIEQLNDVVVLEEFARRINVFGFSCRQHFEEIFMSLLMLFNSENDENIIDKTEQFQIKNLCLSTILELLLTCKMYPRIGDRTQRFLHIPRAAALPANSIGVQKLHTVLHLIGQSQPTTESGRRPVDLFNQPNLERNLRHDRGHGTLRFGANQIDIATTWQRIEEDPPAEQGERQRHRDVRVRNHRQWLTESEVDVQSSVQMMFDIFAQTIDQDFMLILPHLPTFCELSENREHFHWTRATVLRLRELVPLENAIGHQAIVYCLCRSTAVLNLPLIELSAIGQHVHAYLRSSHRFVRNAALRGLLCLLESYAASNTAIGRLSDELALVRQLAVAYVTRHAVADDDRTAESDEHARLVWSLTWYVVETTSKFSPDCTVLSGAVRAAGVVLGRMSNVDQFVAIVAGLQRLVILSECSDPTAASYGVVTVPMRAKIERLAMNLMKTDNEEFALPALELMVTCVYVGAAEQLRNTELANGIVQDEPEVIMLFTDKLDLLLHKIRSASGPMAGAYGACLTQLIGDFIPPSEILTKIVKELLCVRHPYPAVIARIVCQVFRATIDAAYLQLLQDWLICSLQSFLALPRRRAVWSLSVIFVAASIDVQLLRLFEVVVASAGADVVGAATGSPSRAADGAGGDDGGGGEAPEVIDPRQLVFLRVASEDFYQRLNKEQRQKFHAALGGSPLAFVGDWMTAAT